MSFTLLFSLEIVDHLPSKILSLVFFVILTIITYRYTYFSGLQEILIFSNLVLISIIIYDYILEKKFSDLLSLDLSKKIKLNTSEFAAI